MDESSSFSSSSPVFGVNSIFHLVTLWSLYSDAVVLIRTPLMASGVEHLSLCYDIWWSSLIKYLFMSFPHFLIGSFGFFVVVILAGIWEFFVYSRFQLFVRSVTYKYFLSYVACLSILFLRASTGNLLKFWFDQHISFPFYTSCFCCQVKNPLLTLDPVDFLLCFSL